MLTPGPATKVYLAAGPTDLRAGVDKLCVLVEALLDQSATSGHLFVFCNAQRSRIKILLETPEPGGTLGRFAAGVKPAQSQLRRDGGTRTHTPCGCGF